MAPPPNPPPGREPRPARAGDQSTDPLKIPMKTELPLPSLSQAKTPVPHPGYPKSQVPMLLFPVPQPAPRLSLRLIDLVNRTRLVGGSGRKNPAATSCDVDRRVLELEMHRLQAMDLGGL